MGGSNNERRRRRVTYSLVEVVAAELHCRVGHNADAVGAVAAHEAAPAFLHPHLLQRLAHGHLVLGAAHALDLEQDLEALEWGNDCAGDGTGHTAAAKGGHDGVGEEAASLGKEIGLHDRFPF